MSANLFDVGDFQRLETEANLTEQLPRQPLEEDRSPIEESIQDEPNDFDMLLDGFMLALERRLLQ
ncbi:hypothetical protein LCGC14_1058440 [marine sediment metagenome]|uniref:Uncharacterized protein n=1 Tax=marine sediment metagenome TaxID=412755 RepID=A0A0F9QSP4_9ZZZZ